MHPKVFVLHPRKKKAQTTLDAQHTTRDMTLTLSGSRKNIHTRAANYLVYILK